MDAELRDWLADGDYFDHLGFPIFYRVAGSGPVLLAVHGYPFNSSDWAWTWPALTARFTVVAPDMIGMGFSAKPVRYGYSIADHADMHEALLAHLGIRSAHLLTHDLGTSVGQELLARAERGEQTHGPVDYQTITWLNGGLFSEAYHQRPAQRLLSGTPLGDLLAPLQGTAAGRALRAATIAGLFGPRARPSRELMRRFHQIVEYDDGARVLHRVGRFVAERSANRGRWVAAMRATRVPMRLVDGPADPNSGRHLAQRYREVIPNPDVVLLSDDVGHWPQIEVPEAVVDGLLGLVDRVGQPG